MRARLGLEFLPAPARSRRMALVLAMDTCGASGFVALFAGAVQIAIRALPGRETQERLMAAVAEVLAEAGAGLRQVDALAVVAGPGSFTGVRIGMAAVKGFAEALGVPVIAVSRLELLAAAGIAEGGGAGEVVHAWLDAGRGEIFAGRYRWVRPGLVRVDEAMLTREAAFAQVAVGEPVYVAEAVPVRELAGVVLVGEGRLRSQLGAMAAEAFGARSFADVALLDANYLRVPDAELALRARRGGAGVA